MVKWTDIEDIAIALEDVYPDEDIANIRFIKLKKMVTLLQGFNDNPDRCNERILEAIQLKWIEERS
ncbi:Fe-S cluster assembly protein IscX [Candidatus Mesenet endosymbiont of Agriotes lineatus]|uniref:Fe-S cluster assembly protein IscX n=1 Tax=Candidatus Mesenet endosymbiont of Agriotes lineatus TaxID=3077948 RepID=UPI0030CAA817